jgi:hypothetical protein
MHQSGGLFGSRASRQELCRDINPADDYVSLTSITIDLQEGPNATDLNENPSAIHTQAGTPGNRHNSTGSPARRGS